MFKIFIRIFLLIFTTIFIFVAYLSLFGIKTDKFNELINSQIANYDKRIKVDLNDVFVKLNILEKSFSLNSRNFNIFVQNQKQEIDNLDILIGFESLFKKNKNLKKLIIKSKRNEITSLLKFIRTYKINIPTLYLENSISKGLIEYNIFFDFKKNNNDRLKITGKIFEADLNILGKEELTKINLNFDYSERNLKLSSTNLLYNNIKFLSRHIYLNLNNNQINIYGDFENKINLNILSKFIDYNFKDYFDDQIMLSSKSNFNLIFDKKFKIKKYSLKSDIKKSNLIINIKNLDLKNYFTNFNNQMFLKNSELHLSISNDKIQTKINSKFAFDSKDEFKNLSFDYIKTKFNENFKLEMDITENNLFLSEISFNKKKGEEMFLNLNLTKSENIFKLNQLNLFNNKNKFLFNDIKFTKNFKIIDFRFIELNYYNKNDFFNNLSITKKNNNINLISDHFDISYNVENSLKKTDTKNIFDIFENLNSLINLDIKLAKLDNDYSLNNLKGQIIVNKNKLDKLNILAKFDKKNNFTFTIDEIDGKKVTIIFSDIAKPFVKKFKFIKGFENGKLDYTSTEINDELSNSELRIYDFKLKDMPALTKLLSLASLQGIADLATGEGIRFDEFDMFFDNSNNLITIKEIYALGPAISILMEGYIEKNKLVSLRGTLVPATTINKSIAKIPLLGNILVGSKTGEGVFGVSFKIKGPPDDLDTKVNPIKTLTPRFITRTLEKTKKTN